MKAVLAVARLTLLSAIRSRLFATQVLLVLAFMVAMPLLLKGDGTLAGQLRVLLTYAVGLAWLSMAIVTLWFACGSIAREIEDRSLRLIAVTPIRATHIWLGKWLGIAAMNLVLVALTTALVGLMLAATIGPRRHATPPAEAAAVEAILGSRRAFGPALPSLAPRIAAQVDEWLRKGLLPDTPEARRAAAQSARSTLMARHATVTPGGGIAWTFPIGRVLAGAAAANRDVRLQFHYSSSPLERRTVHGAWTFQCGDAVVGSLPSGALFDGRHVRPLPEPIVTAIAAGRTPLTVSFTNGAPDISIAMMFDAAQPVAILVRDASFAVNLLRVQAVAFGFMCGLAALGLTAGVFFSYAVAAFAGVAALLAVSIANSALALETEALGLDATGLAGMIQRMGDRLLDAVRAVSAPAFAAAPLECLTEGTALPWALTARTCAVLIVFYPLLLGALGSFILSRRQLAA